MAADRMAATTLAAKDALQVQHYNFLDYIIDLQELAEQANAILVGVASRLLDLDEFQT